jgi:hypothetical protein
VKALVLQWTDVRIPAIRQRKSLSHEASVTRILSVSVHVVQCDPWTASV